MCYIDWMISGPKIASCDCDYGCPCEFNALPAGDDCEGLRAHRIEEGWFGDPGLAALVLLGKNLPHGNWLSRFSGGFMLSAGFYLMFV